MELDKLQDLNAKRRALRHLLAPDDAADAMTSYYALWHDPRRTQLTLHFDNDGRANGFLTLSQTGADLFRPLITLRAPDSNAVGTLLQAALTVNRPYHFVVPTTLASAVRQHMEPSRSTMTRLYRLDPARFQPVINVLVQRVTGADGAPRFQIESQEQVMAMSGTNWRSPNFAEVFVYVHPRGRGRGWGRSVVSACTSALLEERLRPVYIVDEENDPSIRIAEGLGYVDTGIREVSGEGRLR